MGPHLCFGYAKSSSGHVLYLELNPIGCIVIAVLHQNDILQIKASFWCVDNLGIADKHDWFSTVSPSDYRILLLPL